MEFQRVKRSGPLSITVQLQHSASNWDTDASSDPDLDFTGSVTGELQISLEHEAAIEYPVEFIFSAQGDYLSFDTATRSVTDASEFPVTVSFETHAADACDPVIIKTKDDWFSVESRVPSADLVVSYAAILSSLDDDLVKHAIEEYYGTGLHQTQLRDEHPVASLLAYEQYVSVLDFLYEHGDYDSLPYPIIESRSIKKQVVDPTGAFRAASINELTEKIETYAAREHLKSISLQDVIRETLFDAWDFDSWSDEHVNLHPVDEFISHFDLSKQSHDSLSDENIAHIVTTYYVSDWSETDMPITPSDVAGTATANKYDSERDDAIWLSLGDSDKRIPALAPLVPTAIDRGDDAVIAHFLYSLANSIEREHQKNKNCSTIYHASAELFEQSAFDRKTAVGKEAIIRSHIQRGYPYKFSASARAFECYDAATQVYEDYESELYPPSATPEFLHAVEQALKAVIRQMRSDGDTEAAVARTNRVIGRISEDVEEFDSYGTVTKFKAWKHGVHAANAVNNGSFKQADAHLSQSISHFRTSNGENPQSLRGEDSVFTVFAAELQQAAVAGLLAERDGRFEDAARQYADAADEAESELNTTSVADMYRAWARTADAKTALAAGDVDTAAQAISDIQPDDVDVAFAELSKLEVLVTLFEEYREGSTRDSEYVRQASEAADISVTPEKYMLQYDTEYITGYSLLLSRQRSKKLGIDSGENTEFFWLIEDAITPTGLAETENLKAESVSDGGTQSEGTDSTAPSPSQSTSTSPPAPSSPSTTETVDREYMETAQLQRDPKFLQTVREAYNERCAVCGIRRETPDGRPEVEAAHIKSVSDCGPDTLENGVALCRLHHWAFDNGWLAVDNEYRVLVREVPERDGYADFAEYADKLLHIPDDPDAQPSLSFVRHHREKHGFE